MPFHGNVQFTATRRLRAGVRSSACGSGGVAGAPRRKPRSVRRRVSLREDSPLVLTSTSRQECAGCRAHRPPWRDERRHRIACTEGDREFEEMEVERAQWWDGTNAAARGRASVLQRQCKGMKRRVSERHGILFCPSVCCALSGTLFQRQCHSAVNFLYNM